MCLGPIDYMSKCGMHIFESQKDDVGMFEFQLPDYYNEHMFNIWPVNYFFDYIINRFFIEVPINIHTMAAGLTKNHVFIRIAPSLWLCYTVCNRIQNINTLRKKYNK